MVRKIKRRKVQTVVQQPTTSIWIDSTEPDDQQHQKAPTFQYIVEDAIHQEVPVASEPKRGRGRPRKESISPKIVAMKQTEKVYETCSTSPPQSSKQQRLSKRKSASGFGDEAVSNVDNNRTSSLSVTTPRLANGSSHSLSENNKVEHSPSIGSPSETLSSSSKDAYQTPQRVVCNFSFMPGSIPLIKPPPPKPTQEVDRVVCSFNFFQKRSPCVTSKHKNDLPSPGSYQQQPSNGTKEPATNDGGQTLKPESNIKEIEVKEELDDESSVLENIENFFSSDESDKCWSPDKNISKKVITRRPYKTKKRMRIAKTQQQLRTGSHKLNIKKLLKSFHPVTIVIKNPGSNDSKPFFDPSNLISVLQETGLQDYEKYANVDVVQKARDTALERNSESSDKLSISCPRCSFIGSGSESLKKHTIQVHFKDPNHPMSAKKSRTCRRYQNYDFTVNIKRDVQVFQCENCPEMFSRRKLLEVHHMYMHSQDRKHVCPECSKRFTNTKNLSAHRFTVHGPKNHQCAYCSKCFSTRREVNKHQNGFHLKKEDWKCTLCSKGFSDRVNLEIHVQGFHMQKVFTCKECGATFRFKNSLYNHLKKLH